MDVKTNARLRLFNLCITALHRRWFKIEPKRTICSLYRKTHNVNSRITNHVCLWKPTFLVTRKSIVIFENWPKTRHIGFLQITNGVNWERAVAWMAHEISYDDCKNDWSGTCGINCALRQDNQRRHPTLWILIVPPRCSN